jgi:DNA modification methylase
MIPARVALALQADGWFLRSEIVWQKANPMPESVTDRPTKAHEMIYLLTKRATYWYDADAVREPHSESTERIHSSPNVRARAGRWKVEDNDDRNDGTSATLINGPDRLARGGRNRRSVWTVATQPYPGAHFAVMPEALVEPCILAGCPDQTCSECGAPWERVVERTFTGRSGNDHADDMAHGAGGSPGDGRFRKQQWLEAQKHPPTTTGWKPTCAHDGPTVPGTALDPFGGSGTVARVANRLSRRAILIDLNPDYLEQQMERNAALPLGLVS